MSQKAIYEFDGKKILSHFLKSEGSNTLQCQCVHINATTDLSTLPSQPGNEWLLKQKLVVKPDQLIKRRGKSGLIGLNLDYNDVITWIEKYRNKTITIGNTTGILDTFIIEPFLPHEQKDEYYVCIYSNRHTDTILFHHEGGVDIGDVNSKAVRLEGSLNGGLDIETVTTTLLGAIPTARQPAVATFIVNLFNLYQKLHFTYLEINPLVYVPGSSSSTQQQQQQQTNDSLCILDLAAKLDETATFLVGKQWCQATGHIDDMLFPAPFGRSLTMEEQYIHDLDSKTGASLKLTILNPKGKVWTLIAGGGASVCFADSVTGVPGFANQLANYGEYSGAPNTQQTYEYTKTILDLMTRYSNDESDDNNTNNINCKSTESSSQQQQHQEQQPPSSASSASKVLLIGGAIANFTDVAETFKGIIKALNQYKTKLIEQNVHIYCRRGGPNYQEGLRLLKTEGVKMGLNIQVYGPEVPMTSIVGMALGSVTGTNYTPKYVSPQPVSGVAAIINAGNANSPSNNIGGIANTEGPNVVHINGFSVDKAQFPQIKILPTQPECSYNDDNGNKFKPLFSPQTESIVYGLQVGAVQNMLDFDFICGRESPSVKCLVYPFNGNHYQKFYWNTKEILIPCLTSLSDAMSKYPNVTCVINFSSFRSVYDTTLQILAYSDRLTSVAVIAEGVPERLTRLLIQQCEANNVTFIGPATVGGIKPGCFRIGNAGGMLDNIIASKLYRPGNVAYISKSGGLSNELNNLIAQNTNGVYEGLAIGGDRNPGSTFIPHLLRFEADPNVKMIVLIGEVGGVEELLVCDLLRSKKITKPLISWCIGTVADVFTYDIQFGHAGACANSKMETATYKNDALRDAGAIVPTSFDLLGYEMNRIYSQLVENGTIPLYEEQPPPSIPMDYKWAAKLGLIRNKPTNFISTISDERGEELIYAGVKISDIISNPSFGGLGGTVGLLWFKKQLPIYIAKFIEVVLICVADHGVSVSGAHVASITARAGRDLVSSLSAGLLTVGPRYGGALSTSGYQFHQALYVDKYTPEEFIQAMQREKKLISGIGHKIKTLENPDSRVVEIKKFLANHITKEYPHITFPLLEYALKVEQLTTRKKSSLILNIDGVIACVMVDLWKSHPHLWSAEEVDEMLQMDMLNAFFILGRSIGLIGHVFDQYRLKQPLYRHPDDDVLHANTDLL